MNGYSNYAFYVNAEEEKFLTEKLAELREAKRKEPKVHIIKVALTDNERAEVETMLGWDLSVPRVLKDHDYIWDADALSNAFQKLLPAVCTAEVN